MYTIYDKEIINMPLAVFAIKIVKVLRGIHRFIAVIKMDNDDNRLYARIVMRRIFCNNTMRRKIMLT